MITQALPPVPSGEAFAVIERIEAVGFAPIGDRAAAVARTRTFSRGELNTAEEIRGAKSRRLGYRPLL